MKFHKEEELLNLIKKAVIQRPSDKNLAVLDADGTLWSEDANHILLEYQTAKDKKNFQNLHELLELDYQSHRYKLCEAFVERQAGKSLMEFQSDSREALEKKSLHVFPFQRHLLNFFKEQDMKIIIVTASIQWLVEVAVKKLNLPVDQVIGMKTELKGELITDKIIHPIPAGQNKAEALSKYFSKKSCFLAAGNSPSDQPLLELAEVPFVVHSAVSDNIIFPAERKLREEALKRNWILFEKENNS